MKLSEALELAWTTRWSRQRTGGESRGRAARVVRFLGDRRPTRAAVQRMLAAMLETGLSPASCNRHLSALSVLLDVAGVELELPWQTEPAGRTRTLTPAEVDALAAACLPHRHGLAVSTLIQFLAETGMRVGEALALKWSDLDLDSARPGGTIQTSKNGDPRWVPLTQNAVRAARTQHPMREKGPWYGLSQSTVNHVFRTAKSAVTTLAGDREVVVHALRHTAASRLVGAGVALPVVSKWLGHRDYRSTLRYTHVNQDGLLEAARKLEEAR